MKERGVCRVVKGGERRELISARSISSIPQRILRIYYQSLEGPGKRKKRRRVGNRKWWTLANSPAV